MALPARKPPLVLPVRTLALAALLAKGEMYPVHFRCDDLDETFARIASAPGVEVLQEPASQPWGVRDAAVRDPAGNRLRIEQG